MQETLEARFWDKVKIGLPDECWMWSGSRTGKGYGQFKANGHVRLSHRMAWQFVNGPIPEGIQIDHICCTRACINPNHLRLATNTENQQNKTKQSNNTSGYKGVWWCKRNQRWRSAIWSNGQRLCLGGFHTPTEAYEAYCEAALRLHGEFANLGDVPNGES